MIWRNACSIKDFNIGLSALTGSFHAGSGIILSGDTILPINLGVIPIGIGTNVRLNVLSKDEGGFTGWVDMVFLWYIHLHFR